MLKVVGCHLQNLPGMWQEAVIFYQLRVYAFSFNSVENISILVGSSITCREKELINTALQKDLILVKILAQKKNQSTKSGRVNVMVKMKIGRSEVTKYVLKESRYCRFSQCVESKLFL